MKLVFDIEANGLLPTVNKFHCAGAIDYNTGKEYWFRPEEFGKFLNFLMEADTVIAHNAFGYDIPALKKLAGIYGMKFDIDPAKVQCTKVMSQVLHYTRFGFGHSLKKWGEFFQDNKGDYDGGWEEFNEEMFEYMKQDVRLGTKVYNHLIGEAKQFINGSKSKDILKALRLEMELDRIMVEQCQNGWKFNLKEAHNLSKDIESKMRSIETYINGLLGLKVEAVDGSITKIKEQREHDDVFITSKKPAFTKAGKYHSHVKSWFSIDDDVQYDMAVHHSLPVWGEYTRIQFAGGDIGNTTTVKQYLSSIGWVPDEWNWKKINGQFVKVSAKLSDSSLKPLGDVGQALMDYYTLRSRHSILKGWYEHVDSSSRLHGDVFNVGTPTFRQTHKIIANLPSGKATLGPEIRGLFIAEEGYTLVSADSAACQLRLLAHFMKDQEFTHTILEGDIHQMNADILGCTRNQAKRFIFAYLYGAGAQKLSGYIDKSVPQTRKAIKKYKAALPKLSNLVETVSDLIATQGYIMGLDDRPIFLSKDQQHKSLNYLIQGAEAVVMKATVALIDKRLKEANIDFKHLLFYHDEHTVEVRKGQEEQAKDIIISCFEDAPKQYGIDIMTCGDCNIGGDYYDVH